MQRHDAQAFIQNHFTNKILKIACISNIKLDPNRISITGKIGWISLRWWWLFEGTSEQSGLSRICELKL